MLFGLFKTKEEKKELLFFRSFIRGHYKVFLNKELIEHMLQKGFDINIQGSAGNTLLHWALLSGKDDLSAFLLKNGARADIQNSTRHTPFYIAAKQGKMAMMDLMLKKDKHINIFSDAYNWTFLHMTVREGWLKATRFLLSKNVDINARNALGKTPTHIAAGKWHTGLLEELLKYHPDLNVQDAEGNTPLHEAAMAGNVSFKTIKMLLVHGADPSIRNKAGLTPLQIAVNRHKIKAASALSNAERDYMYGSLPSFPKYIAHQYVEYKCG